MRFVLTCVCAFLVGLLLGKLVIPMLRALKAGQSIREIGPSWHASKEGTPTMGGVIFIVAGLSCIVASIPSFRQGDFRVLYAFVFALVFGIIGFVDDYIKVKKHHNLGLRAWQKALLQLIAAVLYLFLLARAGDLTFGLYIPFANVTFQIPHIIYYIFAVLVILGCVNAVNLTDGIDGLATGVTMPVMLFFGLIAMRWGGEPYALFALALFGGLAAFLCYNFHPAKVFMGDTGSLFLGGAVCGLAFALDMPLILIPVGIIYILETVSVILQVAYFKATHGKRIFRMTPIHHHFEMGGWSEIKIFTVFTAVTVLGCIVAWLGVMFRY